MGNIDFATILSEIPHYTRKAPPPVTAEMLKRKAAAMASRGYIHSETSLKALSAYMHGYGVLLSGGMGIGKTMFFATVNPQPIAMLPFSRCYLWKTDTLDEWLDEHQCDEIVLDDLGIAAARGSNYGVQFDCLQYVLDQRLSDARARTHVTTNCTNEELIERFDARSVDRLYQLCKCFALPEKESRREATVDWRYLKNLEYARTVRGEENL